MYPILLCAISFVTKADLFIVRRRGFETKASRSRRSHHAGGAHTASSKGRPHQKDARYAVLKIWWTNSLVWIVQWSNPKSPSKRTKRSHHDGWPNTPSKRGFQIVEYGLKSNRAKTRQSSPLWNHVPKKWCSLVVFWSLIRSLKRKKVQIEKGWRLHLGSLRSD